MVVSRRSPKSVVPPTVVGETGPLCGMGAGIPFKKKWDYPESKVRKLGNSEVSDHKPARLSARSTHGWQKLRKDRDIKK